MARRKCQQGSCVCAVQGLRRAASSRNISTPSVLGDSYQALWVCSLASQSWLYKCYTKKKGRDGVDLRLNDTTPALRGNGILNSAVNLFFSPLLQCSFVHDRCCIVPFGRLKSQVQLVVVHWQNSLFSISMPHQTLPLQLKFGNSTVSLPSSIQKNFFLSGAQPAGILRTLKC